MTDDQPALFEGVRLEPPKCYGEVVEAMETVISNQPGMSAWSAEKLGHDIWQHAYIKPQPDLDDVVKSVRIWRERNG